MKDDEYEIIPHREIIELKKEIELLKKNPLGKNKSSEHLLDSVNDLSNNITNLINVFKEATNALREEKTETKNDEMNKKIETLFDQNKEIASALVSLADMIKEEKKEISSFQSKFQENLNPIPREEPKPNFPQEKPSFPQQPQFQGSQSFPPPGNFSQKPPEQKSPPPPGSPNQMPNMNVGMPPPPPGMDLPPPPAGDLNKKEDKKDFPF